MTWLLNNFAFRVDWCPAYLWGAVLLITFLLILLILVSIRKDYDEW